MPRLPRLHVPGGLYHVILRGNSRQPIFFDADDRRRWESLIENGLRRYRHRIHAYCWMTNHVHMAVQCHDVPLSNLMSFVASQYARSTNRKLGRSGHLFERRYHAILVQADEYLKELIRYIHLNPMRAGIVDELSEYRWSSHIAYLSGEAPSWLTLDWALSVFGETISEALPQYARFMEAECQPSIMHKLRHGEEDDHRTLGDDQFIASLNRDVCKPAVPPTLDELIKEICLKHGVSATSLMSLSRQRKLARIRAEIGLAAIESNIATNAEVARFFNRSQSGLSRAVSRLRKGSNK